MNKISREFGQLSGEELFKPITRRLDEKNSTTTKEVEENPDYAMDEFDRTYPFGEEFRPDAPTPAPSPLPSPPPSYQYDDDDDDDDDGVLPSPPTSLQYDDGGDLPPSFQPLEETSKRKEWAKPEPVELKYHESTRLQTINRLITEYGNNPNYRVKSKKS